MIYDKYPENTGTQYIYLFLVSDSGCLMSEFAPRIDLVAEAKNHIAFLNEVDESAQLHESQVILNAIRRSGILFYYRPQRSCGKVMFLHLSVILFTGVCLPQCMLGYIPRAGTPPWADTLLGRHLPGRHPPSA